METLTGTSFHTIRAKKKEDVLSGHFFLASPEAGMGTFQDPDDLPIVGTLDAYVLNTPKGFGQGTRTNNGRDMGIFLTAINVVRGVLRIT